VNSSKLQRQIFTAMPGKPAWVLFFFTTSSPWVFATLSGYVGVLLFMEIPSHAFSSSPLPGLSIVINRSVSASASLLKTQIGPGLYIGHQGGIVINEQVVIGKNCNLSQQVTIGVSRRGERAGVPTIGDNVYLGPGAKIFGKIQVGNNAAIGANCVVTRDVPDNGVAVGIPAKVISYEGSTGYINNTNSPTGS